MSGAATGLHPYAKEMWGISNTIASKLPEGMTIKEAAKLIGVEASFVMVVSSEYIEHIQRLWLESGEFLDDAKAQLKEAKTMCENLVKEMEGAK